MSDDLPEWLRGNGCIADCDCKDNCRVKEAADEVERLRAPITMQDVRLCAGEGQLSAATVLQAVNAILARRTVQEKDK